MSKKSWDKYSKLYMGQQKCVADCPDRTSDCHATCERYKEDWARNQIMHALMTSKYIQEHEYDDYIINKFQRQSKKRR